MAFSHDSAPILVGVAACEWAWTLAVSALLKLRLPPGSEIRHESGPGSIAYKRNELAEFMMADERFGALLFVDHDQTPPPDTVERLLAHEVLIVGALYYARAVRLENGLDVPALCDRGRPRPSERSGIAGEGHNGGTIEG